MAVRAEDFTSIDRYTYKIPRHMLMAGCPLERHDNEKEKNKVIVAVAVDTTVRRYGTVGPATDTTAR